MFAIFFASVLPARHRPPEAGSGEAGGSVVSVVNTKVLNGGCDGGYLQDRRDTG
jgi:hypothetical protein